MLSSSPVACALPAKDMERAKAFYKEKLDLSPVEEGPDGIFYQCGEGTSFFLFTSSGESRGDFTQMGFMVPDLRKEVAELNLLLGMITPLGWLERVPTYKERLRDMAERDIANLGLLNYPVLQTVDITIVKGRDVAISRDQQGPAAPIPGGSTGITLQLGDEGRIGSV